MNYFGKKPHLRCLSGFWIRLWVSKLKGKVFSFSFQIICSVKANMRAYVAKMLWVNKGAKYAVSNFYFYTIVFNFYLILDWNIFLAMSIYFEEVKFCPSLHKKNFLSKNRPYRTSYFLHSAQCIMRVFWW